VRCMTELTEVDAGMLLPLPVSLRACVRSDLGEEAELELVGAAASRSSSPVCNGREQNTPCRPTNTFLSTSAFNSCSCWFIRMPVPNSFTSVSEGHASAHAV
jgi:hypothetical protein